jgi:hypothetical protein
VFSTTTVADREEPDVTVSEDSTIRAEIVLGCGEVRGSVTGGSASGVRFSAGAVSVGDSDEGGSTAGVGIVVVGVAVVVVVVVVITSSAARGGDDATFALLLPPPLKASAATATISTTTGAAILTQSRVSVPSSLTRRPLSGHDTRL